MSEDEKNDKIAAIVKPILDGRKSLSEYDFIFKLLLAAQELIVLGGNLFLEDMERTQKMSPEEMDQETQRWSQEYAKAKEQLKEAEDKLEKSEQDKLISQVHLMLKRGKK